MKLTKAQKNDIIQLLDDIGRTHNNYEYGLPTHEENLMAKMRESIDEAVDVGQSTELQKAIELLESAKGFLEKLTVESDEDSCCGMAFVTNRISEDGYYSEIYAIEQFLNEQGG